MGISTRVGILFGVCVVGVLAYVVFLPNQGASVRTEQEHYWLEHIKQVGLDEARFDLLEVLSKKSEQDAHETSHAFGGALYLSGGALTVCPVSSIADEFLSSGCYHEFIGRAIAEHGIDSIADSKKSCTTLPARSMYLCEHGIGHGLVGYLGYSIENIKTALKACGRGVSNNCYRGVLMEYDFRRLVDGASHARVPNEGELKHSICNDFVEPVRGVCVYWEPNWWFEVLRLQGLSEGKDIFPRLFELCHQWDTPDMNLCFAGAGFTTFYLSNATADQSRELCEAHGKEGSLYCKIGAAARFRSAGADTADTQTVCKGLLGEELLQCSYAADGRVQQLSGFPPSVIW